MAIKKISNATKNEPKVNESARQRAMINELVCQYAEMRDEKKVIEERMKTIADTLKEYALSNGVKDSNGSSYVEVGNYKIGNQAKTKVSFNESAIPYLKGKGFDDCIEIKEIVNEKAVEERVNSGELTVEDLTEITTSKVTYAIDVKKLEVQSPDIAEAVMPMAASKKPKPLKRK